MSFSIPVDLSLAESPHPNAILCHKCKALLGSRCRQDRVNQESKEAAEDGLPLQRLVNSEAVAREMVTSDLIEITALEGCILCLLLMDCLLSDDLTVMREHWKRSKEDPNYAPFLVRYELYDDGEQPPFLSVEYEPPQIDSAPRDREIKAMVQLHTEIELQEFANYGFVEDKTSSNSSWNAALQWINTCSETHHACIEDCTALPLLPTRVIDIGLNQEIEPRLHVSGPHGESARYVTLSHCWGVYMPLRLLKNNISSMEKTVPFNQLSRTFQDALIICKRLKIRYVWIDSLCIIQDSDSDWQEQAALMSQFYHNSYLNIAATHAIDGRHGCFSFRNPQLISPIKVKLEWGPRPGVYYCVKAYFWEMNVLETPLQRRGWVCQERFLSPRTLHFGARQLFWECRESSLCEQFPLRMPSQVTYSLSNGIALHVRGSEMRRNANMAADSSLDAFNVWNMIVGRYSSCALTYESDKLIAIAGLASKLEKEIKSQYLAGLWRKHLAYQLLWNIRGRTAEAPRLRTREYIAPTWSWASITAYIENACQVHFADERDIIISISSVSVELLSAYPFGQVKGGRLELEGYLAQLNVILVESKNNRGLSNLCIGGVRAGSGILDAESDEPTTRDDLYYLPIRYVPDPPVKINADGSRELSPYVVGIVLQSRGEGNALEFTREGRFELISAVDNFQAACRQFNRGRGVDEDGRESFEVSQWGYPLSITIF